MAFERCSECEHFLNGVCEIGWSGTCGCGDAFRRKSILCPFCMTLVHLSKEDSLKNLNRFKESNDKEWRSRIQKRIDELHLQIAKVNNPVGNYALSKQVEELEGLLKDVQPSLSPLEKGEYVPPKTGGRK